MRFIETERGFVNLDHVAEIREFRLQGEVRDRFSLWSVSGEKLGESISAITSSQLAHIVPSPSGWSAIHLVLDEAGASLWDEPVIAFAVEQAGAAPIGIDGAISVPNASWEYLALKGPDGRIRVPECGVDFASEDEFKLYFEQLYQRQVKSPK
jgi:hypothetical protein